MAAAVPHALPVPAVPVPAAAAPQVDLVGLVNAVAAAAHHAPAPNPGGIDQQPVIQEVRAVRDDLQAFRNRFEQIANPAQAAAPAAAPAVVINNAPNNAVNNVPAAPAAAAVALGVDPTIATLNGRVAELQNQAAALNNNVTAYLRMPEDQRLAFAQLEHQTGQLIETLELKAKELRDAKNTGVFSKVNGIRNRRLAAFTALGLTVGGAASESLARLYCRGTSAWSSLSFSQACQYTHSALWSLVPTPNDAINAVSALWYKTRIAFNCSNSLWNKLTNDSLPCRFFSFVENTVSDASWIDKIRALNVGTALQDTAEYAALAAQAAGRRIVQLPSDVASTLNGELSVAQGAAVVFQAVLLLYIASRLPLVGRVVNGASRLTADATVWALQQPWNIAKATVSVVKKLGWKGTFGAVTAGAVGVGAYYLKKYYGQ